MKIYGIVEFSSPILCSADVLGQRVDMSIGVHRGTLTMPTLPIWGEAEDDPLHIPLVGPVEAQDWKRGTTQLHWGIPVAYPSGNAAVNLLLAEFFIPSVNFEMAAQQIYEGFREWHDLFIDYVKLLTTQNTRKRIYGGSGQGRIELLKQDGKDITHISPRGAIMLQVEMSGQEELLHGDQFAFASHLCSGGAHPRLEYQLLLEAYSARRNEDYRMAIIEAASALEICLTNRILAEFAELGISFGDKLIRKFRTLGGRFELVRLLEIKLPEKDYEGLVLGPRNDVIHRADFPNRAEADKVIKEVEELLGMFSPQLHEDV